MGNIGGMEILVIFIIALVVLGPTKLPEAARQVGKAVTELRRVSAGFQRELRDAIEEPVKDTKAMMKEPLAETKALIEQPLAETKALIREPVDGTPRPAGPSPTPKATDGGPDIGGDASESSTDA